MHREKQERIARQIALKEARETVMASPATAIKDPEIIAHKVTKVAEIYLRWIQEPDVTTAKQLDVSTQRTRKGVEP
ncbi:MAG: hypothetical protein H0Z28_10040 [Archaeoglobus sp.]|nr:hypothetical protein [Archaeoglobus sp.]